MSSVSKIPLVDVAPEAGDQSQVTFQRPALPRRGFLRVAAAGGMALGVTVLGWIPVGRRAAATVGTEFVNCGAYSYDGIVCTPQVYSQFYCGTDKWFKNRCYQTPDGYDCFHPVTRCNANSAYPARNAWRWYRSPYVFRCADGEYRPAGTGTWHFKICSAALYQA